MFRTIFTPLRCPFTEMLLLVLMLWPAPAPNGHFHGNHNDHCADQHLVEHLKFHHGGLENAANWPEDWHWHWSFSRDGYVGLSGEQIVSQSERMPFVQRCELPEAVYVYWVGISESPKASQLATIPENRRYSFQSVALFDSRQSLPELLGVMRL